MLKSLVSIIIPVYNGSNFLRDAIESALSQTYKNCEVIIVNDGSIDDTEDICLSYGDKIRYYSKENGGVASALNMGIAHMHGDYFSWLSHDDIYYHDKILHQLEALEESHNLHGIVIGNFNFHRMDDGSVHLFNMEEMCNPLKIKEGIYPALFGIVHACAMLVHKDNIKRVGSLDENLRTTQDIDWIFRLLRNQKTTYTRKPLVGVRLHPAQGKHHIKSFNDEQAETHISFINRISEDEILNLFSSKYLFYRQMMSFYRRDMNQGALEYTVSLLANENTPDNFLDLTANLHSRILSLSGGYAKKLCIFCAGNYGRILNQELFLRGISVDCFSDNNSSLWGTIIDGVECIPPNNVEKDNTLVIVAMNHPQQLISELKNNGFCYITDYFKILSDISNICPL